MLNLPFLNLETILLLIFTALFMFGLHRLNLRCNGYRPATVEDYLYKLARITQKSEHEIFHEAAEQWPVSSLTVEEDFKHYLINQIIPYYVNDFIRKNRKYLDSWKTPPF